MKIPAAAQLRIAMAILLAALSPCFCAMFASLALATRVLPMNVGDLIRESGAIFIGTVENVDPICPGRHKPCTQLIFSDVELVAGHIPRGKLTFMLPEGLMDDGT